MSKGGLKPRSIRTLLRRRSRRSRRRGRRWLPPPVTGLPGLDAIVRRIEGPSTRQHQGLSSMGISDPEDYHRNRPEGAVALGALVVARGQRPELLAAGDQPLDPVAQAVRRAV